MNRLFSDMFRDCWPDVLRPENTVHCSTGTEKYSVQYYPHRESKLFTVHYLTSQKNKVYFRHSIILSEHISK